MSEISSNITPIVVAFTPNYLAPAATTLFSVLKHSDKNDQYRVICLLTEELDEDMKQALKKIDVNNQMEFEYILMHDKLQGVYVDERYTIAASFRLLISELLPQYDKVIYMDCDMIIRNNLAELYRTTEPGDNYLGAVYEAALDFQAPNLEKLGFKPGEYFNSGFLVMNLEQLRKDDMAANFIEALKVDYLEFPDQDVLNMLCKGRVVALPPQYNSIRTYYLPQYKKFFLQKYTESDWDKVQKHGNIHYTGDKPWRTFTVEFDVWWQYYLELPNEVKEYAQVNPKMEKLYRFYSTTVGRTMIETARKLKRFF